MKWNRVKVDAITTLTMMAIGIYRPQSGSPPAWWKKACGQVTPWIAALKEDLTVLSSLVVFVFADRGDVELFERINHFQNS